MYLTTLRKKMRLIIIIIIIIKRRIEHILSTAIKASDV